MVGIWHLQERLEYLQKRSLTALTLHQGELSLCVFIMDIMTDEKDLIRHPTLHVCYRSLGFMVSHIDHN